MSKPTHTQKKVEGDCNEAYVTGIEYPTQARTTTGFNAAGVIGKLIYVKAVARRRSKRRRMHKRRRNGNEEESVFFGIITILVAVCSSVTKDQIQEKDVFYHSLIAYKSCTCFSTH